MIALHHSTNKHPIGSKAPLTKLIYCLHRNSIILSWRISQQIKHLHPMARPKARPVGFRPAYLPGDNLGKFWSRGFPVVIRSETTHSLNIRDERGKILTCLTVTRWGVVRVSGSFPRMSRWIWKLLVNCATLVGCRYPVQMRGSSLTIGFFGILIDRVKLKRTSQDVMYECTFRNLWSDILYHPRLPFLLPVRSKMSS